MTKQNPVRRVTVSVDVSSSAENRVAWAASLTEVFGSHLTGMAAARPEVPSYAPLGAEVASLLPAIHKAAAKQVETLLQNAEAVFQRGCKGAAGEWKASPELFALDYLTREARSADLVVVGQGLKDEKYDMLNVAPGEIILSLGRPLMVVPSTSDRFSASRVLIAWKEGSEARRALFDAIPYLAVSEEVVVCAVGDAAVKSELADVVAFLEAHDIAASPLFEPHEGRSDSDALLAVIRRIDATLIVAGAYGRSRLKEWVFGGVTRDLLHQAPVPCLFSR